MIDSEELDSSQSQPKAEKGKDSYKKLKLLGQGAYGKAFLVESTEDGSKWVMKQINISDMTPEQCDHTTREAKILEQLNHPNIVRFRQVYRTNKMKLSIVMEYADGGDLASKIAEQKKTGKLFEEVDILNWFTQICLAIKHVHDRKVIHRDIKGQNIFLTSESIVKLGDFGIARVLHRTVQKVKTVVGTPYYLSPEIIENKPYSFKSDIWSLGVLLYEMCALTPPFTGNSLQFLALKIVKGSYTNIPPVFSRGLQNLIKGMLNIDPNRRPSIHQILDSHLLMNRITDFLSESKKMDEFSHTILHKQNILKKHVFKAVGGQSQELSMPPNLLRRQQPPRPQPPRQQPKQEKKQQKKQTHFGEAFIPPPAPKLMKGTPPIQHKAPINGFYRPPSSNMPRPIVNPNPDLGDLLNIKAPPLNPHVMKTPLPKIKTPENYKKRPSTPNLAFGVVGQVQFVVEKILAEGDFKKKPARYSADQPEKIKRGASEERVPSKNRKIDCAPKLQSKGNIPKMPIPKAPTVPTPKNPQLGMNAFIPEPISNKPTRKDSYNKPQSAGGYKKKTQEKVPLSKKQSQKKIQEKTPAPNKHKEPEKRIEQRPVQKKEPQPIVKKQSHKNNSKPVTVKKQAPKKIIKKKEKAPKPLQIKSEEVIKKQKQQKKVKREQQRKKMKDFIQLKRKQLSETERKEEQMIEIVEEQKTQELPNEVKIPESVKDHNKSTEEIEQEIQYTQQPFEEYQTMNDRLEYSSVPDLTAPTSSPSQDEIQYPISINLIKQQSHEESPKVSPRRQRVMTSEGKTQLKHSVQFNKMLEEMQQLVVKATDAVNSIPQKTVPDLKEMAMELTLPADRQDDSQSIYPSDLQYSKTQQDMALECLADHSKLEDLKITLEDVFGVENFIAAYRYVEKMVEQRGLDFDETQTIKAISNRFPAIKEQLLSKYFSLLVTVVVLENPLPQ